MTALLVMETEMKGLLLLEPHGYNDQRGTFTESYNKMRYLEKGITNDFLQDNHSLSREPGTIRGLHYQLHPKAQIKLVRCIVGAIYDVVVDIRRGSLTFGKWQGFILTPHNCRQLLVPKGFAHGFCTLVPNTEVLYKVDEYFSPEHDRGIAWNDPSLGIDWPVSDPILSEKDRKHPTLADAEINFAWEEETK